jgi:DNA-binding MarR family transcriptional regulator
MPNPDHNQRDQFTATILQIFRANGQLISWGDRFAAPFELTSARWQMLGAIALTPEPLTTPQLAINMGVTRQGAQKQLNLLLDEGLVQKKTNPTHKRSPFYQLTNSGKTLYQQIESLWNQHATQMASNFSPEELATALKVLSQINTLYQASEQENDTP